MSCSGSGCSSLDRSTRLLGRVRRVGRLACCGAVVNADIGAPGSYAEANLPDAGGLSGNLDHRTLRDSRSGWIACPLRSVDRDFLPPFSLRGVGSATVLAVTGDPSRHPDIRAFVTSAVSGQSRCPDNRGVRKIAVSGQSRFPDIRIRTIAASGHSDPDNRGIRTFGSGQSRCPDNRGMRTFAVSGHSDPDNRGIRTFGSGCRGFGRAEDHPPRSSTATRSSCRARLSSLLPPLTRIAKPRRRRPFWVWTRPARAEAPA